MLRPTVWLLILMAITSWFLVQYPAATFLTKAVLWSVVGVYVFLYLITAWRYLSAWIKWDKTNGSFAQSTLAQRLRYDSPLAQWARIKLPKAIPILLIGMLFLWGHYRPMQQTPRQMLFSKIIFWGIVGAFAFIGLIYLDAQLSIWYRRRKNAAKGSQAQNQRSL